MSDPFYSLVENMEICKNKNGLIIQLRKTFKDSKKLLDDLSEFIKKFYQGKITVLSLHKELDEEIPRLQSEYSNPFISKKSK